MIVPGLDGCVCPGPDTCAGPPCDTAYWKSVNTTGSEEQRMLNRLAEIVYELAPQGAPEANELLSLLSNRVEKT